MFVKAKDSGRTMPVAEENAPARSGVAQRRDRAPALMNGGNKSEQEISVIALMNTRADLSAPAENAGPRTVMCSDNAEPNSFRL